MPDYVSLAATAQRLVDAAGRQVTLVRLVRAPTDAGKPWRGADEPRDPPEASLVVRAAFVDPASLHKTGMVSADVDWVKKSDNMALIGPNGITDVDQYDEIEDGGRRFRIQGYQMLKPADIPLLFILGVCA